MSNVSSLRNLGWLPHRMGWFAGRMGWLLRRMGWLACRMGGRLKRVFRMSYVVCREREEEETKRNFARLSWFPGSRRGVFGDLKEPAPGMGAHLGGAGTKRS